MMTERTPKNEQIAIVKAWAKSGMTSLDFGAKMGVKPATLRGWKFRMVESGEIEEFEEPKAPKAPKVELVTPAIEVAPAKREGKAPARAHKLLAECLDRIAGGFNNLLVVGPAGSGKTTLASQIAESLGLDFACISLSGGANESHLFGRRLPDEKGNWTYFESPFVRIYRDGGVFLLDEMDAADANVLLAANAALANGFFQCPVTGARVERHADTIILGASNTFGTGADAQYVGRNALDASTRDRFAFSIIEVDYDRDLERSIARSMAKSEARADEVCALIWRIRDAVAINKLRRIVGTRSIMGATRFANMGRSNEQITAELVVGWSAEEKRKVGLA